MCGDLVEIMHASCAQSARELVNMKEQEQAAHFNIFLKDCETPITMN